MTEPWSARLGAASRPSREQIPACGNAVTPDTAARYPDRRRGQGVADRAGARLQSALAVLVSRHTTLGILLGLSPQRPIPPIPSVDDVTLRRSPSPAMPLRAYPALQHRAPARRANGGDRVV